MTEEKVGFLQQVRSFPKTFYIANTMEIFERTAWYGMFTPLGIYMTDPTSRNGLGFSEEDTGVIIGIATFILYLLPVVTGALGDRFGYKKMFILAFSIMTPAYYLLGHLYTFWSFLGGYLFLALGAAVFKPVVVGTVARVSNEKNSQLAFGVFYMMVNVGGFIGPAITGALRRPDPTTGISNWHAMFTACAIFIAINFIWVFLFYREPTTESKSASRRTLKKVLTDAVEVLGNVRFFLCVFGMLVLIFAAGKGFIKSWTVAGLVAAGWLIANLAFDWLLRLGAGARDAGSWFLKPMKLSNWRFALYLLILSGFWTSFNQIIGATIQWYIRDFVQTKPLMDSAVSALHTIGAHGWAAGVMKDAQAGGQVNPEWLSNLDPFFIVIFQIVVSLTVARVGRFGGLIGGTLLAAIGISIPALAGPGHVHVLEHSGWLVVACIFVFSIGEMAASPTSQEYISTIAPPDKVALYMGYYFVAVALGNLFGGVLGGQLYGKLARNLGRPDLMWLIFGGIGILTAISLALYNRYAIPRKLNVNGASTTPVP